MVRSLAAVPDFQGCQGRMQRVWALQEVLVVAPSVCQDRAC